MTELAEHYHWFYSTIAQSLASLIGIMGVFVIFRLQALMNDLEQKYKVFIGYLERLNNSSGYETRTKDELFSIAENLMGIEERDIPQLQNRIKEVKKPQGDLNIQKSIRLEEKALEFELETKIKKINKIRIRKQNIQDVEKFRNNFKRISRLILAYLFFVLLCSLLCLSLAIDLSKDPSGDNIKRIVLYLLIVGIVVLTFGCIACLREVGTKEGE